MPANSFRVDADEHRCAQFSSGCVFFLLYAILIARKNPLMPSAVRSERPEVDAAVFYEYIIHTAVAENVCGFRKAAVIQIEAYDGGRTKLQ